MANAVTAKTIQPFGNIAAEIEHMAWTHEITAEPEPIDAFASTVTRLCDQDITLDRIEMLLVKLERAELLDGDRSVELHAAYLRQNPKVLRPNVSVEAEERPAFSTSMSATMAELARAAANSLVQRRASGEIMTYGQDGWMVREFPGGRVERLCPIDEFTVAKFPHPGFTPPTLKR
jgi:hypothetical protein